DRAADRRGELLEARLGIFLQSAPAWRTILLQAQSAAQRDRRVWVFCSLLIASGLHGVGRVSRSERRSLVSIDARTAFEHPLSFSDGHRSEGRLPHRLHSRQPAAVL